MNRDAVFQFRLDAGSGVPVYRQIIDQVLLAVASGRLRPAQQLPTVRQVAVDLAVNPNTVMRAYRELEIRGVLATQQGSGTYVSSQPPKLDDAAREDRLDRFAADCASRAGAEGFALKELISKLTELAAESGRRR